MSQYLCPTCGTDSKVLETRPSYNRLRRRRVCNNPDAHKFSTVEVPIDAPEKIVELIKWSVEGQVVDDDMIDYIQSQIKEILLGLIEEEPCPQEHTSEN